MENSNVTPETKFRDGFYFAHRDSTFMFITYPEQPTPVYFPTLEAAFEWANALQMTVQVLQVKRLGLFQASFGSSFYPDDAVSEEHGWHQDADGLWRPHSEDIHT